MGLSHADPVFGASGSDDGTMQIWDPRQEGGKCVGTVEFGSPVCCVEFIQFVDILYRLMCCQKAYDVERTQDVGLYILEEEGTPQQLPFEDPMQLLHSH
ncbi:WD repeat-containing protein RUP2-like protein [Tanacetum coccineum]